MNVYTLSVIYYAAQQVLGVMLRQALSCLTWLLTWLTSLLMYL